MNAITMLKAQHREVAALFEQLEKASSAARQGELFEEIADALAVHAAIEERHFYPAVKDKLTEGILRESVEEHLQIKRAIADLLDVDAGDETFLGKVADLRDDVERHVEEEETDLFPKVQRLFDDETLAAIAAAMEETQTELVQAGSPRFAVPGETETAAPI
jgi:hemerythrin-like domain-containing protein